MPRRYSSCVLLCLAFATLLLLSACGRPHVSHSPFSKKKSAVSSRAAKGTQRPYTVRGVRYYPLRSAAGFSQKGKASWYGRRFHGRRTASGERFNMYAMTCAHKRLPMNSRVRVTNLRNGKSVVVRVNDRGPFARGRVIDLSYAAAKKLGFVRAGTARVRVRGLR